jgi:hypothetical protein
MASEEEGTDPGTLTSTKLTRIAEAADGCRDKVLEVTLQGGNRFRMVPQGTGVPPGNFRVYTKSHQPERVPVGVTVSLPGAEPRELTNCDAIFWSESAMEKFVWPYYRAHRLWDERLSRLKNAFEKNASLGLGTHTPSSRYDFAPHPQTELLFAKNGKVYSLGFNEQGNLAVFDDQSNELGLDHFPGLL